MGTPRSHRLTCKSFQILSKIAPGSLPGGSKIDPRRLQNRPREPPEERLRNRRPFLTLFPPLGRLLGHSWRLLGPSWVLRGLENRSKNAPKGLQNQSRSASEGEVRTEHAILMRNVLPPRREHDFRGSRGLQIGSKSVPKWLQNGSREASGSPTEPGAPLGGRFFPKSA